jgi:hypothetical protein
MPVPYHLTIPPRPSRKGTLRTSNHRSIALRRPDARFNLQGRRRWLDARRTPELTRASGVVGLPVSAGPPLLGKIQGSNRRENWLG